MSNNEAPNQTTDQEKLTRAYRDQRDEQTARLVEARTEIARLRRAMKTADENGDAIGMRVILREALQKQ